METVVYRVAFNIWVEEEEGDAGNLGETLSMLKELMSKHGTPISDISAKEVKHGC